MPKVRGRFTRKHWACLRSSEYVFPFRGAHSRFLHRTVGFEIGHNSTCPLKSSSIVHLGGARQYEFAAKYLLNPLKFRAQTSNLSGRLTDMFLELR